MPNLPKTSFGSQISNWYSFQEFFGLRPALLQYNAKKAKTFFICCFCDEAWDVLLTAAKAAGPVTIHGCLSKISEFPPNEKKQAIITMTNQQLTDFKDLHAVHTDRLRLCEPEDEQTLLFLTPNLMALSPRFVNHLPSPIMYTLFFQPDPTTLSFNNHNLHKAHLPPHLLAPAPRAPFLRAGSIIATTTSSPPRKLAPSFDDTDLDDIFNQWSTKDKPAPSPRAPQASTQKRQRSSRASARANTYYSLTETPPSTPPPNTPDTSSPPSDLSANLLSSESPQNDPIRSVDGQACAEPGSSEDTPGWRQAQPASPLTATSHGLSTSNYYAALADDENSATHTGVMYDSTQTKTQQDSGSETDLNRDAMSTSSSDPSFSPSPAPTDDEFSADDSDDLSVIYSDQKLPPQDRTSANFNIMDYEAVLSQQALAHYQQLHHQVAKTIPVREAEFTELLDHAIRTNQDPVNLTNIINTWPIHHP
jgi:hypothetical protein